MTLNNPTTNTV